MTDKATSAPEKPLTREERLALRLRENLRRRKAQARAMEAGDDADGDGPPRCH